MSNYIRSIKEVYDFDGDKVEVILKPILFEDVLRFHSLDSEEDESRVTAAQRLFADILPKYIDRFDLKAKDGSDVTVTELCTVAYFTPLVVQIGSALMKSGAVQNPPSAVAQ